MNYVILDLEWNASYSSQLQKYVNEIIEFGAVKVDEKFNITDKFSRLILPQIGKRLSGRVKKLTKITNEELRQNGVPFMDVAEDFARFSEDCVLITWGTTDIHALIENYQYYTDDCHMPFFNLYCDAQHYCEKCLKKNINLSNQLGLGACAELLGVNYEKDEQHRAFADAELTLECIKKLIGKFSLSDYIIEVDAKFYDRIIFKNHFITDLNNSEVDKKQLKFRCEKCRKKLSPKKKWKLKSNSFVNEFICPNCGYEFIARVSFKQRFDGVVVKRKTVDKKIIEAKKAAAKLEKAKKEALSAAENTT